jgi:hypothetical protein
MARRDVYHYHVKEALVKDGWTITNDPLNLTTGGVDLYADLGAERILGAQRGEEKIAVEIKSFLEDQSLVTEFHKAHGQYDTYFYALLEKEPDRIVYLAIPLQIWETFFQRPLIKKIVETKSIKIIAVDIINRTIALWIK